MSGPRRAHELELHVSAHTLDNLAEELRQIADRIEREGLSSGGACGGVEASHTHSYSHDPSITPDSWRAALKEYIASRRREAT